jgi:hypothetical protein
LILIAIGLLATASVATADTITSTLAGGLWFEYSTWEGGVVPGSYDDVVIAGPVQLATSAACLSLSVLTTGTVGSTVTAPNITLAVSGAVTNAGAILENAYNFIIEVGGDLHNDGVWNSRQTTIVGTEDRFISHSVGAGFATNLEFDDAAAGDVIVTTPLSFTGNIDMTGGQMVLQPDCPLTMEQGYFSGGLLAQGNEMHFLSWSYLDFATIDDVVLVGELEANTAVIFTTRVIVMGVLQNGSGGGGATVEGDLINHGTIQNDQYSFLLRVWGDIENFGTIDVPQLEMMGVGVVHRLTMGPSAVLDATVFLPEFEASTLIAETPVTFGGGLGLGVGKLILQPGASLHFSQHSGLGSGTVEANGNTITTADYNSALSSLTIDRGVFGDYVTVYDEILFTNGLTVAGILESWQWAAADLTVEGLLRNEGEIRDGDYPVAITAMGDVENLGIFTNAQVVLAGYVDQAVGAGPGINAAAFVLESGLDAASYQWYKNNAPLPGEEAASLTLATVGPAEYGIYHCVGDGMMSRNIVIDEQLVVTDIPDATPTAFLEQNYPNPFNPTTEFAFSLDRATAVTLVVYDIAGREVDRLVERELGAGRHQVSWQPRDLASGTYFYRLRAGDNDAVGKCTLLK